MRVLLLRIHLILVCAMAATACVPVSRAQGLDATPITQAEVQTEVRAEVPATATPARVAVTDLRLFQPQVMNTTESETEPVASPRMWLDLSIQPQMIDFFNQRATENDIARVEHVSMIDLLQNVTVGRKLVIFKNAADVEELIPLLFDQLDIIGFNLEGGPYNRPDEQADPIGSARRVRALADEYGLQVALGPDHSFALNYGAQMAPFVDIFVLQVQRVQTEHETVREFVLPMIQELLAANPDLEISVQLRTEGDEAQLVELLDSLGPELAGVSILTSQDTLPTAYVLYEALDEWRRAGPGPQPALPTPVPTSPVATPESGLVLTTAAPTSEPRRTPEATPDMAFSRSATPDWPTRWLLFGSGLIFGGLLAGLAATWIVFYVQRMRAR